MVFLSGSFDWMVHALDVRVEIRTGTRHAEREMEPVVL